MMDKQINQNFVVNMYTNNVIVALVLGWGAKYLPEAE